MSSAPPPTWRPSRPRASTRRRPADLYALALVLYEALTGVNPVRAGTAAQRARRLGAHLPPLRRQRRDLPRELGRGIDLALRPKPRERGTIEEFQRALRASLEELSDGSGRRAPSRGVPTRTREHPAEPEPHDATRRPTTGDELDAEQQALPWPERGLGALAAALATAWLAVHAIGSSILAPPVAALLAAVVVAAMPRLGWLALTAGLTTAALATGHAGSAVVLIPLALVPVALLPRAGAAWPLAAGAPALGIIGLAGAWPALAAKARTPARRAGLGAAGWFALILAAPFAASGLYLELPPNTPPPSIWTGSAYEALHHVLAPLISDGLWAPAPVWALAAVTLPRLVTRRSLKLDIARVTLWSALLVAATAAALGAAGAPNALQTPHICGARSGRCGDRRAGAERVRDLAGRLLIGTV